MTTRKLTADTTGPLTIDATLLGHGGTITVRAERDCERATLTIHTADEDGPAADAVREATLRQTGTGLYASVQGKGGTGGGTTIITGGGGVIQSVVSNGGSVVQIGGNIVGGDVIVNGRRITGATVIQGSAPVEITAVVPVGSSVSAHTQSADVEAKGTFTSIAASTQSGDLRADTAQKITASTQSGSVTVNRADEINARTQSGAVVLNITDIVDANTMSGSIDIRDFGGTARLATMSGNIRVHATAGGDINARTMSGDIDVTATQAAVDDDLDVQTSTMSGRVRTPQRRHSGGPGPRRRRA